MHVIPGMDTDGAPLAAAAIFGPSEERSNPPDDTNVTKPVTTESDLPLI